jgi:glycosyltransferase involved in cell wall biosynthesis
MTALASRADVPPSRHPPDAAITPAPPAHLRRARVLFINDTARNGGPGRSLHSILKFLDPAAVHRAVVLPRDGAVAELLARDRVTEELRFEPHLVENPIEPWGRPMERPDFEAPAALKAARLAGNVVKATHAMARLASLVRRERFDLIYCNGTNADFAGGALAGLTGVPALWHVRYTSLPPAVRLLHARLASSAGVRRIVCVSRAAAALFPQCPAKVRVIHNALDVQDFDPAQVRGTLRAELGLAPDAVVFGSHGRVLRRKGYVEMARAARLVVERLGPGRREQVAFVVVGDTPEDFRPDHVQECRALAASLGIDDRFKMLGFRADVKPLVADFDVAVVPSVYADPLPRSVIESMALGKPVVAFDVGGVVEMVDDGLTGQLVRFEAEAGRAAAGAPGQGDGASAASVERLASAMLGYVGDAELRRAQGLAGRERILRDFDARAHARRIQDEILRASGLCSPGAA